MKSELFDKVFELLCNAQDIGDAPDYDHAIFSICDTLDILDDETYEALYDYFYLIFGETWNEVSA